MTSPNSPASPPAKSPRCNTNLKSWNWQLKGMSYGAFLFKPVWFVFLFCRFFRVELEEVGDAGKVRGREPAEKHRLLRQNGSIQGMR